MQSSTPMSPVLRSSVVTWSSSTCTASSHAYSASGPSTLTYCTSALVGPGPAAVPTHQRHHIAAQAHTHPVKARGDAHKAGGRRQRGKGGEITNSHEPSVVHTHMRTSTPLSPVLRSSVVTWSSSTCTSSSHAYSASGPPHLRAARARWLGPVPPPCPRTNAATHAIQMYTHARRNGIAGLGVISNRVGCVVLHLT
jgi:hypothetical protein